MCVSGEIFHRTIPQSVCFKCYSCTQCKVYICLVYMYGRSFLSIDRLAPFALVRFSAICSTVYFVVFFRQNVAALLEPLLMQIVGEL